MWSLGTLAFSFLLLSLKRKILVGLQVGIHEHPKVALGILCHHGLIMINHVCYVVTCLLQIGLLLELLGSPHDAAG